jgi:hypothetical protein
MLFNIVILASMAISIKATPQGAPQSPALPVSGDNGKNGGIFGMGDLTAADMAAGPTGKGGTGRTT